MNFIILLFAMLFSSCLSGSGKSSVSDSVEINGINFKNPDNKLETVNLINYGAKGLGLSSVKEDTTALRKAIAYLNTKGGGKLYIPNPPKFYAFAGDGVFVGDNIEIYGDGKGKSEIRNVSPTSGNFLNGPIFLFSTFGPTDNVNIFQTGIDQYYIQDTKMNETQVVLKNQNDAAGLFVGEVVVLGSGKFNHGNEKAKSRFHNMELNEISAIKGNVIEFRYPISVPLVTRNGESPVIVNINNTKSKNKLLQHRNGTSKNIYIHDLTFSQAQTDELNNNASLGNLRNGLSGIFQPGGAFNSRFKNLKIDAYGGLDGNMFTRCTFSDIDIKASKKLIDFGYGGSNDTLQNINWEFGNSPAAKFASSFIICNDGTHNIVMNNINAKGNWNGELLLLLSQVRNIVVNDLTLDFPNYKRANALVLIGDKEGAASKNITLKNLKITVNTAGTFLRIKGSNTDDNSNRNITISELYFTGTLLKDQNLPQGLDTANSLKAQKKAQKGKNKNKGDGLNDDNEGLDYSVYIKNIHGLKLHNVHVSSGDLQFENCDSCDISEIVAPASELNVKGSRKDSKFEQLSVKRKNEQN
jgi:hypothetical protein